MEGNAKVNARPFEVAGVAGERVSPWFAVGQSLPDGHLDQRKGAQTCQSEHSNASFCFLQLVREHTHVEEKS